jgi:hypothetical protein
MTARATGLVTDILPALLDPDRPVPQGLQDGQGRPAGGRFNVYRNTITASLIAALEQGFPAVAALLGPVNFTAIARGFVRDHPPRSPLLMQYGAGFPAWLEAAEPLSHLGYLGDVARLELARRRAYHAADSPPLPAATLAAIPPEDLGETRLTLAPAVALLRSDWPVHAIWRFALDPDSPEPQARPEDVLITRPVFDPLTTPLPPGGAAAIGALLQGDSLGAAQDAGLAHDPGFTLTEVLSLLLAGGAIIAADPPR